MVSNIYENTDSSTLTLHDLAAAAATRCNGLESVSGEFCGLAPVQGVPAQGGPITSGIFFTIPWCAWQINQAPTAACLYTLSSTGIDSGSPGGPPPVVEITSPCATTYDDCQSNGKVSATAIDCSAGGTPPATESLLMQALYDVCEIDQNRASNPASAGGSLPPLAISFELSAGYATPVPVQASIASTLDLPITNAVGNPICARFPVIYAANYTSLYQSAFTSLLSFLFSENNYSGGPEIPIAKIGGINDDTAELVLNGDALPPGALNGNQISFAADPGPANLNCTWVNGTRTGAAHQWQQQFGNPRASPSFDQTVEDSFGTLVGAEYGAMTVAAAKSSVVPSDFILSIATRNGQFLPDIDCGENDTPPAVGCLVDNPYQTGDQWSAYYLIEAIQQLQNTGSGAGLAAITADPGFSNFSFSQLAIDSTNLEAPPAQLTLPGPPPGTAPYQYPGFGDNNIIPDPCYASSAGMSCPALAKSQISCNLNNITGANQGSYQLVNQAGTDQNQPVAGIGTIIGWQTNPGDASGCSSKQAIYPTALAFGIDNGGQYIEISIGEATSTACQPDLVDALHSLLASSATHCLTATN